MDISKIINIVEKFVGALSTPELSPLVDDYVAIREGEQSTEVSLGVPGCTKSDIRVTKAGDKLLVYVKGKMVKSLFLTKSVDKDKIKSTVKDGILRIDFKKALEFDEEEINID